MLRQDVIDAVERGRFHIHAVKTVDDAMELLTGLDAGEADQQGRYPDRSVNGKVRTALRRLAEHRRKFAAALGGDGEADPD
jgi:predicted ATP-dependent protease